MSQITSHLVGRISDISDFEDTTGVTVLFADGKEYVSSEPDSVGSIPPIELVGKNGELKPSVDLCTTTLSRSSGTVMKSVMKASQAL
jgi:hypothetical protein